MQVVKIPGRIDDPPHFLLWSADELAPMMLGITVGVFLGKALICFLIGFLITNLYRKFRDNNPDGYLQHMLYWSGIPITKSRCMVNPYIRRFFP